MQDTRPRSSEPNETRDPPTKVACNLAGDQPCHSLDDVVPAVEVNEAATPVVATASAALLSLLAACTASNPDKLAEDEDDKGDDDDDGTADDDDDDDDDDDNDDDKASESGEDSGSTSEDIDDEPGFLHVNGQRLRTLSDPKSPLLAVLRHEHRLTGSKYGCGEAQCGACTVMVDGVAARSCVIALASCWGKRITTVEGLADGENLSPVQQAFLEEQALQCGYCTPGMVVAVTALLQTHPDPSRDEIVQGLQGNVCRCGTYPRIIKATQRAAKLLQVRGLQ